VVADRAALAKDVQGKARVDDRRAISAIVHLDQERVSVVRLPAGIGTDDNDLQPLRALGGTRCPGVAVPRTCRAWSFDRDADDCSTRVKAHHSASGAKSGNRGQAIAHTASAIRKSKEPQMLRAVFLPSC